jgi:hypothetical protein
MQYLVPKRTDTHGDHRHIFHCIQYEKLRSLLIYNVYSSTDATSIINFILLRLQTQSTTDN